LAALRTKTSAVATLVLADISPKKLLEAREVDKQTGLPKRNCRYCRLLCGIFDAFFIDEYMSWITETQNAMPISVGLMIREGLPLVINCWGFTYDKYILKPRVDLEVYSESAPSPTAHLAGAPSMGTVGPRSENVGSERCMRFMKECVRQCCGEYEVCTAQATGFVPTRLICLWTKQRRSQDLRVYSDKRRNYVGSVEPLLGWEPALQAPASKPPQAQATHQLVRSARDVLQRD